MTRRLDAARPLRSASYEPPKVEDIAGGDKPLAASPAILPVTGQ